MPKTTGQFGPGSKFGRYGAAARRYYVREGLSIVEVARRMRGQVSERTLRKWRDGDNWEQRRLSYTGSEEHAVEVLRAKLAEGVTALEGAVIADSASLADTLSKIDKILDRFEARRDPIREAFDVLDDLGNYLAAAGDTEALKALSRHSSGLIAWLERRERW